MLKREWSKDEKNLKASCKKLADYPVSMLVSSLLLLICPGHDSLPPPLPSLFPSSSLSSPSSLPSLPSLSLSSPSPFSYASLLRGLDSPSKSTKSAWSTHRRTACPFSSITSTQEPKAFASWSRTWRTHVILHPFSNCSCYLYTCIQWVQSMMSPRVIRDPRSPP